MESLSQFLPFPLNGLAGLGAQPTGTDGGLGGLFATLLGDEGGVQTPGTGQGTLTSNTDTMLAALMDAMKSCQVTLPEGAASVTVQGEATLVEQFTVMLQSITQRLVQSGFALEKLSGKAGTDRAGELAQALETLGVPPEEAQAMAERLETALRLVEAQQQLTADQQASMALMLMAQLVPQAQGQAQVVASTLTVQIQQVSVAVVRTSQHIMLQVPHDPVRELLQSQDTAAVQTAMDQAGQVTDAMTVTLSGTQPNEQQSGGMQAALRVVMPETTNAVASQGNTQAGTQSAQAVVMPATVVPVAPPQPVVGEARYRMHEPKEGEAVVEVMPVREAEGAKAQTVVQPVAQAPHGSNVTQAHASAQVGAAVPPVAHLDSAAGAGAVASVRDTVAAALERVAQAQDARVAPQVALQLAPLAERGGGQVHMTLNPPELGKVSIELTVHDGKVHGTIAAGSDAVVEQLARDLHVFRNGLAEAGLKLGDQGLTLMLSTNLNQDQQQQSQQAFAQQGQGAGHSARGTEGTDEAQALVSPAAWVAPDRLLDMQA